MREPTEILGVQIPTVYKNWIKDTAEKNRLTMSDVARMLIADSIEHISERNILKVIG